MRKALELLPYAWAPGTFSHVPRFVESNQMEQAMGIFTKDIQTMEDLFVHGLQDIYYAETQITKALPKMIGMATNRDLSASLKAHLDETNKQIERLNKVFEKLGKTPSGMQCTQLTASSRKPTKWQGMSRISGLFSTRTSSLRGDWIPSFSSVSSARDVRATSRSIARFSDAGVVECDVAPACPPPSIALR
jgi:hypothetical protein